MWSTNNTTCPGCIPATHPHISAGRSHILWGHEVGVSDSPHHDEWKQKRLQRGTLVFLPGNNSTSVRQVTYQLLVRMVLKKHLKRQIRLNIQACIFIPAHARTRTCTRLCTDVFIHVCVCLHVSVHCKVKFSPNSWHSSKVAFDENFIFDQQALNKWGLSQLTALHLKLQWQRRTKQFSGPGNTGDILDASSENRQPEDAVCVETAECTSEGTALWSVRCYHFFMHIQSISLYFQKDQGENLKLSHDFLPAFV